MYLGNLKQKIKHLYSTNTTIRIILYIPVAIYSPTYIYFKRNIKESFFSYRYYHTIRVYHMNDLTIGLKKLGLKKTKFPHPIGIVIGIGVKIGQNCTVYQNVTIGAKNQEDADKGIYPKIGNNVIVGCNAVILGDVNIGNNVIIGAATIVNCDIPNDVTVVGNPCKVIRKNI